MARSAPVTPSRHSHLAYMQHRGTSPVTASSTPSSPPSSPAARAHTLAAAGRRPTRPTSASSSHGRTLSAISAPLSTSFAGTFDHPQVHRDLLFHLHLLKFMTTEYIPLLTFAWGAGEVTEQEFQGEQGCFENRKVALTMVIRGENKLLKESSDVGTTIRNLEMLEMVMEEWLSTRMVDSVLARLHKGKANPGFAFKSGSIRSFGAREEKEDSFYMVQ